MAMTPKGWSINGLAVELCMDRRTIAKICAGLSPVSKSARRKEYRLAEVVTRLGGEGPPDPTDGESYDKARLRKMIAEADAAELETAKLAGEVISIEDAEAEWTEIATAIRAKLLSMPSKLAPLVAAEPEPTRCRDLIEGVIFEALAELADGDGPDRPRDRLPDVAPCQGKASPKRRQNTKKNGAATKADGQPVGRSKPKAKSRGKRRTR